MRARTGHWWQGGVLRRKTFCEVKSVLSPRADPFFASIFVFFLGRGLRPSSLWSRQVSLGVSFMLLGLIYIVVQLYAVFCSLLNMFHPSSLMACSSYWFLI